MGRRRKHPSEDRPVVDVSNCRIAIVGAGLCGLAVAVALEQALFDKNDDTKETTENAAQTTITIYERDESLEHRREGYGLTLGYRPDGTLDKLGILDALTDFDCPSRSHYILRGDGRLIGYFGNAITGNGFGQRGNLRVPRQRVRQVLQGKLKRTSICWNHQLVGLEQHVVEYHASDDSDRGVNRKRHQPNTMKLFFKGGTSITADLVIGADGIRSDVVRLWWPQLGPPRPMGVRLILGLTRHHAIPTSPLLQEQGFYTLESGCRLFVMPFSGSALGHSYDPNEPVRYMWQLSFRDEDSYSSSSLSTAHSSMASPGKEILLREAKTRTLGWHDPVSWLIENTTEDDIWGTMLHDRDPAFAIGTNETRVIVAGDALHAMSPFKGQGANQCLQDALTIAKWIGVRGKTFSRSAVACCQRELVQRTAPIVEASRQAAQYWHSEEAVNGTNCFSWAGLAHAAPLIAALEARDIRVDPTRTNIDQTVRNIVHEMKQSLNMIPAKKRPPPRFQEAQAAAKAGCLRTLRRLSWDNPDSVRCSSSECLLVAAQEGHLRVVHWLITECGCPIDFCTDGLNHQVRSLMERLT